MRRIATALAAVLLCASAVIQSGTAQAASPEEAAIARAQELIDQNPQAVRLADGDQPEVVRAHVTPTGSAHVRFTRRHKELPVVGGDFVVHIAADGSFDGASVSLDTPIDVNTDPRLSAAAAAAIAQDELKATEVGEPQLIVDAVGGTGRLAWQLPVTLAEGGADAVIDAGDGSVLRAIPHRHSVTGIGHGVYSGTVTLQTTKNQIKYYSMIDPNHGGSVTCNANYSDVSCDTFTDLDNEWGDGNPATVQSAAVDVHYGTAIAWDYYTNVLGRNGFFNDGTGGPVSMVHVGRNWDNAMWDEYQKAAWYGDGSDGLHPLVSLDVVGHELTHGVTHSAVSPSGLIYADESGGLNEATSDIFGTMTEWYAANPMDPFDYQIGEEVDYYGTGAPLRYMYQPSLDGRSKDCYYDTIGQLDPHYSSGVANHFFFLLAEGSGPTPYGTSPTCDGSDLVGIGKDAAARIWYHALDDFFLPSESYHDARNETLKAAADLYGMCGARYHAVEAAWAAVGVVGGLSPRCLSISYRVYLWYPDKPILAPNPLLSVVRVEDWGTLPTIEVGVHITHPHRGDLRLSLLAPSGQSYLLKEPDPEDPGADVAEVFPVQLDRTAEPGEWTLIVEDVGKGGEAGYLRGWSLLA